MVVIHPIKLQPPTLLLSVFAVWERGAGLTLACGTGACAAVVAGFLNGYTGRKVTVHLTAGDLNIEWAEDNHLYMTGPAEEVFSGDYPVKEN